MTESAKPSRRRLVLILVLSAVVVAAGVTGGVLVLRRPGATQAAAPLAASVADGPAGLTMVYLQPSIAFADAQHGYLLLKLCPTGSSRGTDRCDAWVARTTDGGARWQAHRVPGVSFPRDYANMVNPTEDIMALDATHVAFVDRERNYQFSGDAGERWMMVEPTPTTEVATIAANAHTTLVRARNGGFDVGVLAPNGTVARLSNRPGRISGFTRGTDGSLWFAGATLSEPQFAAYTSQNGGRTWVSIPVPDDEELNNPAAHLLTNDGHTLYAVARSGRVWRTTDLGQHWQGLPPPFASPGYVAASMRLDGSLALMDPSSMGAYVLAPDAASFAPLKPSNGFLAFGLSGARYVSSDASLVDGRITFGTKVAHSADGVTWTEIPYPPAAA